MYPNDRVAQFINKKFVPIKIHVKEHPEAFGRFEAQFDLVTADNVRVPLLTKTDAGYEPNVDAEEVAEALDAWATVSATINAAELEDLYALPASTEESAEAAAA